MASVTIAQPRAWRILARAFPRGVLLAVLVASAAVALAAPASAGTRSGPPRVRHVVVVGVSGLRWSEVTQGTMPVLWSLARDGSVGDLVDYAQRPLACPADGWLTLNSGARAAAPVPCGTEPAVAPDGTGARIARMPGIVAYNGQFHETPDWGLLGRVGGCATAVGPGAALALATSAGTVSSYLPRAGMVTAAVLARCPLTVIDLGTIPSPERSLLARLDSDLGTIRAAVAPDTRLVVTAPGGVPGANPHLELAVVNGPGYANGLLRASSTRQPGIVTLTDLTTTVAGWLGRTVPSDAVGARITAGARGGLASAVSDLVGRDIAEQVWIGTHARFIVLLAVAEAILFGLPALLWPGSSALRKYRRARWWRTAAAFIVAVPAGTFLANLVPWWSLPHPAVWLYATGTGLAVLITGTALSVTRGSHQGTFGIICFFTLVVLGADVMTGSRLQLEVPFGLSLAESGRFYGIGNDALGVYCVSAVCGAAWAGGFALERWPWPGRAARSRAARSRAERGLAGPGGAGPRRAAVACASVVALFAVIASGWPGFGAKAGGTIVMVPCFLVLLLVLGEVRVKWSRALVPVAASGVGLLAAFALASHFAPALGVSDLGAFAGNVLHGRGGALLERKLSSNVSTLTASDLSPLVPLAAVVTGVALWYPSWFRLRSLGAAFSARPLLRVTVWLVWLVLIFGWFADDSGVVVPAVAIPFTAALVVGMTMSVSSEAGQAAQYRGNAFAGSSVAGQADR